jgi:circadian clock protein KaiC
MIQDAVEQRGARVVVIDSLNGYLNARPDGRFLTAQLHELLAYLNHRSVATFLVAAQSGLLGPNMQSTVDASYLADSVMVMRMFEHEGRVKRAISMLKKRSGRHEETIRQIWFDASGVLAGVPVQSGLQAAADTLDSVNGPAGIPPEPARTARAGGAADAPRR